MAGIGDLLGAAAKHAVKGAIGIVGEAISDQASKTMQMSSTFLHDLVNRT